MGLGEYRAVLDALGHASTWGLQETTGTVAEDEGPLALDGNYVNGPALNQSGPIAGVVAVDFEANNDHVITGISDDDTYSSTDQTIVAWINVESTVGVGTARTILTKDHNTTASLREWHFGLTHSSGESRLRFFVRQSGGSSLYLEVTGGTGLVNGTWYMATAVLDGTNTDTFVYLDTALDGSDTTPSGTRIGNTTQPLSIGGRSTAGTALFDGKISFVSYFDYALTSTDIQDLYDAMYQEPVEPQPILSPATLPAPLVSTGSTLQPVALASVTTLPAPIVFSGTRPEPGAIPVATIVPPPTISTGSTVSPEVLVASSEVIAPNVEAEAVTGYVLTPGFIPII